MVCPSVKVHLSAKLNLASASFPAGVGPGLRRGEGSSRKLLCGGTLGHGGDDRGEQARLTSDHAHLFRGFSTPWLLPPGPVLTY